jgi:hypothetical protein
MRAGKVLAMDEEEVLREADRVSREIWLRHFRDHPDLEMPDGLRYPRSRLSGPLKLSADKLRREMNHGR